MKYSRGGHVLTIRSLLDHRIQLIVTDDNSFIFKLSIQDTEQMQEMNFTGTSNSSFNVVCVMVICILYIVVHRSVVCEAEC